MCYGIDYNYACLRRTKHCHLPTVYVKDIQAFAIASATFHVKKRGRLCLDQIETKFIRYSPRIRIHVDLTPFSEIALRRLIIQETFSASVLYVQYIKPSAGVGRV